MKRIEKSTHIALAVLIGVAFLWLNFSILYFSHAHVDENGHLIFHAHPFHENTEGHHLPHHTHTKIEYIFLSAFYHLITLLIAFLSLGNFLPPPRFPRPETAVFANITESIRRGILKRGPPFLVSV